MNIDLKSVSAEELAKPLRKFYRAIEDNDLGKIKEWDDVDEVSLVEAADKIENKISINKSFSGAIFYNCTVNIN